jgi:NAD(P)-dependent dehydrogenase (short-subunit alcohol dehydrogenase family)
MEPERVALVTGASRGIGRAIALALAEHRWAVVVNFRGNENAALETISGLEKAGGSALAIQADISHPADRERLVDEILKAYHRIDLLVNNAGMAPRQRADLLTVTEDNYDEVMAVNLKGPFFLTQRVANTMIGLLHEQIIDAPKIINIGSISAYTSSLNRGEYCISKAGMGMMTSLFADRLAEYGINVYEVRPGIIATDMTAPVTEKYDRMIADGLTPIQRWGQPEDVAKAVVALAEGYLPFSTGEIINVDGGFHIRRL